MLARGGGASRAPMRALILGAGSIGLRHARNLQALRPGIELVFMRRAGAGVPPEHPQAKVVHSLQAGLDCAPSLAVIATPTDQHCAQLEAMLEAGVPCYVEKPVAANAEQVHRLEERLRMPPGPPPTQTGCNLRFLPSLQRLRELVHDGTLGRVVRASLEVGQWLPDWRPQQDYRTSYSAHARQGGGVILDLVHEIDQARWLFGEFEHVQAQAGKFSSLEIDAEDTACILLGRRATGPLVSIALDYVSRRPVRRYAVVGEGGSAVWDLHAGVLEVAGRDEGTALDCGLEGFDVGKTYARAMQAFLAAVDGGQDGPQNLADGLRSTRLALRSREAAGL